ncbi:MAG: DHH family phosphoesterase [Candidatus Falkowbacteria bacterium]
MLDITQQIFKQIEKSERPLIVFPADWRGDVVASSLALFLFLKKLGKEVEIVAAPSIKSQVWSFLPAHLEIKNSLDNLRKFIISLDISQTKISKVKYAIEDKKINFVISPETGWFKAEDVSTSASGFRNDLIFIIGTTDLESLSSIYENNVEFFYKTSIINIDNQAGNEEFGQINLIDINAAANSEILFSLLQDEKPDLLDEDIATCLLAGIIANTKNFKTVNLTPKTLISTSKLIDLGARREEIIDKLYRSRDFKTLKLWGKVLNNLNSSLNGRLIWSTVKRDDFKNAGASEDSLLDIIDELIINIPEAYIITIIFEDLTGQDNKILLYTIKNLNALEILKEYAPEGSPKIANARISGKLEESSQKYLNNLEIKLKNLS